MTLKRCWTVLLLLALIELSACAEVQPWERGRLSKPHMSLDADPLLTGIDAYL